MFRALGQSTPRTRSRTAAASVPTTPWAWWAGREKRAPLARTGARLASPALARPPTLSHSHPTLCTARRRGRADLGRRHRQPGVLRGPVGRRGQGKRKRRRERGGREEKPNPVARRAHSLLAFSSLFLSHAQQYQALRWLGAGLGLFGGAALLAARLDKRAEVPFVPRAYPFGSLEKELAGSKGVGPRD